MQRLIVKMSDRMFDALCDVVMGTLTPGLACDASRRQYAESSTSHIEGHVHAEVFPNHDVKKITVCNAEKAVLPHWAKQIARFRKKVGDVKLEFFDRRRVHRPHRRAARRATFCRTGPRAAREGLGDRS